MMEKSAELLASSKVPPNLMKSCVASKNESETVKQLTEKMHKLKFRFLDMQSKNQMLRKELKIANKVVRKEIPDVRDGYVRGREEEAVCLRSKIDELKRQIKEIEGNPAEDGNTSCQEDKRISSLSFLNKQAISISTAEERLVGCGVEVKVKIEYWKNRNAYLEKTIVQLRLELDRLLEKGDENKNIQREYGGLEGKLRASQSEKLEMRGKLDACKTRNRHLSEELETLREDSERMRSKTNDDNMLLEALTSQQGNFQDLIERQHMIGESDHQRFRDDLRKVQVRYSTTCNILEQLEETTREGDDALQELRDRTDLMTYAQELDEHKETSEPKLPDKLAENIEGSKGKEQKKAAPLPPLDPELCERFESVRRNFESTQEEVEQLTQIAINNNRKLNEWSDQLRQAKMASAKKTAELRGLQESVRKLENLTSSKNTKSDAGKQDAPNIMDELLIKLNIESEVHRFMERYWKIMEASTDGFFRIYASGSDRITKNFIDILREKKKSFAEPTAKEVTEPSASSWTDSERQSSSKTSSL